jgi:hypothetical protein
MLMLAIPDRILKCSSPLQSPPPLSQRQKMAPQPEIGVVRCVVQEVNGLPNVLHGVGIAPSLALSPVHTSIRIFLMVLFSRPALSSSRVITQTPVSCSPFTGWTGDRFHSNLAFPTGVQRTPNRRRGRPISKAKRFYEWRMVASSNCHTTRLAPPNSSFRLVLGVIMQVSAASFSGEILTAHTHITLGRL